MSLVHQFVVRTPYVRRPPGTIFDEKYAISTTKHPLSQMTWVAMCNFGTSGLYFLTPATAMNGQKCVELLTGMMAIRMHIHKCTVLMHDGAPCHRSYK